MEYLRQQFHQELDATVKLNPESNVNEVKFGDLAFPLDQVLRGLDPVAYDEAFTDWIQSRKGRLIERADEILQSYSNRNRFRMLREVHRQSAVIPFIGAGMSMTSGYPGWTNFLRNLREETLVSEADLETLLQVGQYEEAAQLLADHMPANIFNEQLDSCFGQDRPLSEAIQYLPQVFNTPVITTNFDNVIQRSYNVFNMAFADTFIGTDADEIRRYLGEGVRILVKLHGKVRSANGRILTFSDYESHYPPGGLLPPVIDVVCTKTLLFLGCSLTTDRTVQAMREIAQRQLGAAVRHYAFLPLENEAERINRSHVLSESSIFPIWYPADADHDEVLEALLLKLQED